MFLRVVGCPDKNFRKYIRKAVSFYGKILLPNKILRENIELVIKFDRKMSNYGECSVEGHSPSNKAREFLIKLHPDIGADNILKTLAHELVHVKQFARHETNDCLTRWHGSKIDSEEIEYYDHPWEIEAYGKEGGLYYKFMMAEELWKVFKGIPHPDKPDTKKIVWKKSATEKK